ncbi:uncharacterized protein LOC131344105 [Hemibagrus wyckioides]|uniref:uncharacterized protein LOC131344105 n=1 Tax=Hemibagrus wyckioides TaxID=337641 RepID=UPI00266C4B0D|nr:uncharacterized protein LOC131344105 [Hemibagrus wyckioides]
MANNSLGSLSPPTVLDVNCHLSERGVTDIGLKVPALREAFATLLASIHNQDFLFVVGKRIVMRLAAANNQDVVGVLLAYEALIRFLRTSSNQESIKAELSSCDHHYNFLDVFYELILFGCFINGSKPQPFKGGFLERLLALFSMWDVDVWEPAAELYFTVLIVSVEYLLMPRYTNSRDCILNSVTLCWMCVSFVNKITLQSLLKYCSLSLWS